MSGLIGHVMYAVLAQREARQRGLSIAPILEQYNADYLAGSYLGCDIQTMPEAICVDTGTEVGYGTVPLKQSPLTGGPVRPYVLEYAERPYRPRQIHQMFYGRSHLVFGWHGEARKCSVSWDRLPSYVADVVRDTQMLFQPVGPQVAYLFGWVAHVVGDSLIKSVHAGVDLKLLDGKYTPKNRPIQQLVTFHEVGRKELQLDWSALLHDLARTPVPSTQPHYMRVAIRQGRLGRDVPEGWVPDQRGLLLAVLAENRRYLRIRIPRLLKQLELTRDGGRWQCDSALSRQTGGLSYDQMVRLAEQAGFRHALDQISDAIVRLFQQILDGCEDSLR